MAIAVWVLYAADRLLDTEDLELRHRFHHRHRIAFLAGIFLASIALAVLLPHIAPESMHRYLILGGLVFGYFVMIHATRSAHRLPKELAVGVCFAAAVFIPTISRRPDLRLPLLVPALLVAALCSLNCLFIYAWEHADKSPNHPPHTMTQFALGHLAFLAAINIVASVALATFDRHCPWPIPAATAISTTLLLALHLLRTRYVSVTLRAAADLTLLTPLIFLPLL